MKVKDLIKILLDQDMDNDVWISIDEEGNRFKPLSEPEHGIISKSFVDDIEHYVKNPEDRYSEIALILWPLG